MRDGLGDLGSDYDGFRTGLIWDFWGFRFGGLNGAWED